MVGKAISHLTHNKSSIPVNSQFSVTVGRMQENSVFHFGIFELVSHITTVPVHYSVRQDELLGEVRAVPGIDAVSWGF